MFCHIITHRQVAGMLALIPVDVFLQIIDYILDHPDLASLAATCKSCHNVVMPVLYNNPIGEYTFPRKYVRFAKCLTDSNSALVHEIGVFDCRGVDDPLALSFRFHYLDRLSIILRNEDWGFLANYH